jgi:hypothetical protein
MGSPKKTGDEIAKIVVGQLRGPVADQVRQRMAAWTDPVAKLDRRQQRVNSTLTLWLIFLVLFTGAIALGVVVAAPAIAVVGGVGVAGTGVLVHRNRAKAREITAARGRLELTATVRRAPLPARSSAARQPMERLAEAEETLAELLAHLDSASMTSVPTESVEQARATAAEAVRAIRVVSTQLQAVERARDTAPPLERGQLVEGVRELRRQLDEAVDGYCGLVGAAGRTLAASTASDPRRVLVEATDHLAGLASALRDIRP